MCLLKVQPNWKDLGKRLGKQMKDVAKAVNDLTTAQIVDFMNTGVVTLCGFTLTKEDIVVKREFNGDAKRFEAAASDDGSLMVAVDTTVDEEMLSELRARSIVSAVQKLRKSSGLVVSDVVEVFYEVSDPKGDAASAATAYKLVEDAFKLEVVGKRLKTVPVQVSHRSPASATIGTESLQDADICKGTFTLWLAAPAVAVKRSAVAATVGAASEVAVETAVQYLQTVGYARAVESTTLSVGIDGVSYVFKKGEHYFGSVSESL
jgi:hypothetical protein